MPGRLLSRARASIAALLAGGGGQGMVTVSSDPGLQFRAVDAFTDLVEELALEQPLVVGVDDLQWADPSSLLTLGTMGGRLVYAPVALIGCFRPAPAAAELQRAVDSLTQAGARRLTLGSLAGDAVASLVADTVGAPPGPGLLAGVAGAAGNPLFVTELLAAMAEEGSLRVAGGRAEVAEMTLPPTLRLTILRRVSFLPHGTLQALEAASILGPGFSLTDLSVVTGRPATELSVALMEAIRAGVLEDDGTQLRFRRDLIRDAVYEDLPQSVRRGLHREAGQRFAASGAPALQVARQMACGAAAGDTGAITWLVKAAREAAPRSPDVAADLLGRAAGLMRPYDLGRDRLLAELAGSQIWTRIADAEATCRALLGRGHDPAADGPARIVLGHALIGQGRTAEGFTELERAQQSAGLTEAERARAQAWAAIARLSLGDLAGAATTAEHARSAAAGDPLATSMAMLVLADTAEWGGHLRDALQIIDDAVRLADESPSRLGHRYPLHAARGHILAFRAIMEHEFPLVLGFDGAGRVEAVGAGAGRFAVGDLVHGQFWGDTVGRGTFAERVAIADRPSHGALELVPEGLKPGPAAAAPTAGMTAEGAVAKTGCGPGQTLLILGATGGVGVLAAQLAARAGITVIATARGEARAWIEGFGASETPDRQRRRH